MEAYSEETAVEMDSLVRPTEITNIGDQTSGIRQTLTTGPSVQIQIKQTLTSSQGRQPSESRWNSYFLQHVRECLAFFFFKVFLILLDVGTDLATSLDHFKGGNKTWGSLTIIVMFLPCMFTFMTSCCRFIWFKIAFRDREMPRFSTGWQHLPFVQGFRNARLFFAFATMDTSNTYNTLLVSDLQYKARDGCAREAFLESAPQLILQIYILIKMAATSNPGFIQGLGISVGFVSLWYTSVNLFFVARIAEEKDCRPNRRFMVAVAPFAFIDLLGSIILASVLAAISKGAGLAVCMLIIILTNLGLQKRKGFSKIIKKDVSAQENLNNRSQVQKYCNEVAKTLQLSALTSWLTSSVIVKSKITEDGHSKDLKIPLMSSAISIITYSLITAIVVGIEVFIPGNSPRDHSILICAPRGRLSFEHQQYQDSTMYLFGTAYDTITSSDLVVRVCATNEDRLDVMWRLVVPCFVAAIILKLIGMVMMITLSDYERLILFIGLFGGKTFHPNLVIANPEKFKTDENIFQLLLENPLSVNRQHPLRGITIMHVAHKFLTPEQVVELCRNGAKPDIKCFQGFTPKDKWNETTLKSKVNELENEDKLEESSSDPNLWHFNTLRNAYKSGNQNLFSLVAILGAQTKAKNVKGQSVLEFLAEEMSSNLQSPEKVLKFLKFLPFEVVFNILDIVLNKLDNIDDVKKILKSTFDIILENTLINTFKSLKSVRPKKVKELLKSKKNGTLEQIVEVLSLQWQEGRNIHEECKKKDLKRFKHLLESGLDPDVKDCEEKTPLHLASEDGLYEFIELLLHFKANPDAQDKDGKTPLHLICEKQLPRRDLQLDTGKVLLELKPKLNAHKESEKKWLELEVHNGRMECVLMLLNSEANPNAQDKKGQTPLHLACKSGNGLCVEILIAFGAKSDIKDSRGNSPCNVAFANNHRLSVSQKCLTY